MVAVQVRMTPWNPPLDSHLAKLRHFYTAGVYAGVGRLASRVKPVILAAAKAEAPRRTGAFANSIVAKQRVEGPGVVISIEAASPLATFITGGTRPHPIYPRYAKVLRFTVASGAVVYARHVSHPGTAANPFPERAIENTRGAVEGEVRAWATGMQVEVRP